ncbi:MAG: hypothetical protein E6230_13025 [Paenibacillus dendritiformis]|uniref:hypothetical protein n=1 Tax=Paenibacillus dendritiformis TaxID=130049 RepID=UPI001AFF8E51|nr:hypothetical protein [Paenibacillus dendritiformis]MDU5143099.1 hypothetical protein [Paenibacillus dendritiformis]GIO74116.1 hypothetical protein J27TS7_36300 [Paenibacillus dendritiformis]
MNDRWREALQEEMKEVAFAEKMKQEVIAHAKPSLWEREIRIPLRLAIPGLFLSLLLAFSPLLLSGIKGDQDGVAQDEAAISEDSFVYMGGIYIRASLLEKEGRE